VLNGVDLKRMSKPYNVVNGREKIRLLKALIVNLEEEEGAEGWERLRINLLVLEKNVTWNAVEEGYRQIRIRLFL